MAFIARDVPSVGAESSSILYTSIFMLFCMAFLAMVFSVESLGMEIQLWLLSFVVMWISVCYMLLIVFRKYAWINLEKPEINALFLSENRYGGGSSPSGTAPGNYGNPSTQKNDGNQAGLGTNSGNDENSDVNSKDLSYAFDKQKGDVEESQPQHVRKPSGEPNSIESYGFSVQTSDIETTDSLGASQIYRNSVDAIGVGSIEQNAGGRQADSEIDSHESESSSPEEIEAMNKLPLRLQKRMAGRNM